MAWDERMRAEERAARRQALLAQWELDTLPNGAAARHLIDEVIDPPTRAPS